VGKPRKAKKHCRICGGLLSKNNVSGLCGEHYQGKLRSPRSKKVIYAFCCNDHCEKKFVLQKNQHPKYTLCPACKIKREKIRSYSAVKEGHLR